MNAGEERSMSSHEIRLRPANLFTVTVSYVEVMPVSDGAAPSSGGVSIDGYTPSPYRMGNTLLARVRGLLAPYLS